MLRRLILGFILSILIFFSHPQLTFADPLGNWLSTTNLPNPLASHISYTSANKISVVGGANTVVIPTNISSVINNADGSLLPWISSGSTLTLFWHSSAIKDNFLYILGGATFPPTVSLDTVYKGVIDNQGIITSWTSLTPLPQNLSIGSATVVGNRLYFAGGFTNGGSTNQNVYFASINPDGTIGSWTVAGLLPAPMSGFGMVEYNNYLIVIGGETSGGVKRNKVYKALVNSDGSLSAFTPTSDLPEAVYRAGVIRIGSTLVSIGGYTGINTLDKIYYATINSDGTIEPWQLSGNHIPQPVCCGAIAYSNGFLYLTGGFGTSGYLDTVYYAPINTIVEFADFKQTDPNWSTSPPYDPNNIITSTRLNHNAACGDMYGYGCAVTSVADVFYSYGNTTLSNNEQLDPGTLNDWLSDDSIIGFDMCYIYWDVAAASVKIGDPANINRNGKINWPEGEQIIDEALENGDLPILGINTIVNGEPGTHFLVVDEKLPDINGQPDYKLVDPALYPFTENNPGNSGKSLTEVYGGFNKVFKVVIYKKGSAPQNTLAIGAHSPVQLLITDPLGNTTGYDLTTGEIIENIPDSSYGVEPGIAPVDGSAPASAEKKYFQLTNPTEGEYIIQVIGVGNGNYTLGFARTDEESNVSTQLIEGFTVDGIVETYKIQYSNDTSEPIVIEQIVTFDTFIADINLLYELGEITNRNYYRLLLTEANLAKKLNEFRFTKRASEAILKLMQRGTERNKGRYLSETAYQILNKDIEALLLQF